MGSWCKIYFMEQYRGRGWKEHGPLLLFNPLWWAPSVLNRYCWVHKNRESLSVYSDFNVYSRRENMKLLPQNVRNWPQVAAGRCLVSTSVLVFAWNKSKTTDFGPISHSSDIGKFLSFSTIAINIYRDRCYWCCAREIVTIVEKFPWN